MGTSLSTSIHSTSGRSDTLATAFRGICPWTVPLIERYSAPPTRDSTCRSASCSFLALRPARSRTFTGAVPPLPCSPIAWRPSDSLPAMVRLPEGGRLPPPLLLTIKVRGVHVDAQARKDAGQTAPC